MRYLILNVITTTLLAVASASVSQAQQRANTQPKITGEVQAITPCELYAENDAPICLQVMVPVESTVRAIPVSTKGSRRAVLLRSDADGHLVGTLPRTGRYRLALRKVQTRDGSFSPDTLKITPNTIRVSTSPSPALFLVSHRSRPTFNVGIGYAK